MQAELIKCPYCNKEIFLHQDDEGREFSFEPHKCQKPKTTEKPFDKALKEILNERLN